MGPVIAAILALSGCNDSESDPANIAGPSKPQAISTVVGTWIRVANLSSDLNGSRVRLDGRSFRERLNYPAITGYQRIEPGSHRIVFLPPAKSKIDPRTVELETTFNIGPDDAVTIIASGLVDTRTLRVTPIQDVLVQSPDRVRIRLINAMSDFPSPLGLWQNRRIAILRRVEYLEDAPYRNIDAGNFPLEVRRTGTKEALLPVIPYGVARNATYTMFAYGTLRREDLAATLTLDATEGFPTQRAQ